MIIKSVVESDEEAISGIIKLHNSGRAFDLDPCFSVGNFYKRTIPAPRLRFDVSPSAKGVQSGCATFLPIEPESISSIIFDPPFMFGQHGQTKNNLMNKRFSMFATWSELEFIYKGALAEFHSILKRKGIVAFKCQDYTDSRTTLTHCHVYNWACEYGFYPKDLFILFWRGGRIWNPKLNQKHARKFHSYWFVLEKR